jgi:hypothetical protein
MSEATTISPVVGDLLSALAKAHAEIDNVSQDREVEVVMKSGGKYRFRYATLAGILSHIRGPLTANGIWYTQRIDDGMMVTRLLHSSGQWMDTGHVAMPNINGSPQDVGSIVSYFKRYSLSAALGLASEEDNDGEQGDRQVNFRARGERRERDEPRDTATGVAEPDDGWGDWARSLIISVERARDEETLDTLKADNRRYINGVNKVDAMIYKAIQDAFIKRRQAVKPNEAF